MTPTKNKTLPCAIFGHNYKRTKTNRDHTIELTCMHCDVAVTTDLNGNFDTNTVSNSLIKETFQDLYRLTHRLQKVKVS